MERTKQAPARTVHCGLIVAEQVYAQNTRALGAPGLRVRLGKAVLTVLAACCGWSTPLQAQFFIDPNSSFILSTLREISVKHQLGLEEQRRQTAQMVQQLKVFYDTQTLLRNDVEFTQGLYNDLQAVKHLDITNDFTLSNFIMNADRMDYWLPATTTDLGRSAQDVQALTGNADALQRTYESFAVSTKKGEIPDDLAAREHNALLGQEVFSQALLEYAIKSQHMSKTYDSMAVELQREVMNNKNKYTEAERTQLLLEAVKLRENSNSYYEKYLKLSEEAHTNELNMYDKKLNFLSKKFDWQTLKSEASRTSKVRYGFFDITAAKTE